MAAHFDPAVSKQLKHLAQDAKEAGALGYMARALVQATLSHSKQASNEFECCSGAFTLVMLAPSKIGLPYGVIPRLMMAWMTTEAVRTKQRELQYCSIERGALRFMTKVLFLTVVFL